MRHFRNIPTKNISWLNIKSDNRGGVISDLYYPEDIEELKQVVLQCQKEHRKYYVFGHTSNSYLLPCFSPEVVISVLYLRRYNETDKTITVECGMHSKVLAKMMVDKGYEGFEGLVDLPGTISGAIYGNAGCYGCLMSDHMISAKVLLHSGVVVDFSKDELGLKQRTSKLKDGIIKGTILTVEFEKIKGDVCELKRKAQHAHENRLKTQPGPANNLGSIFKTDELTTYGNWIRRIGRYMAKFLRISENSHSILKLKLFLSGYPSLEKYLFDMNRFIWKDKNAHKAFDEYLKLRKKLYKHNKYEIEIFG